MKVGVKCNTKEYRPLFVVYCYFLAIVKVMIILVIYS